MPTPLERTIEQRRDWNPMPPSARRRGEVVVTDGFGVRIRVERARLVIEDGAGRHRRTRRFSRAGCRIQRLIVLGGTGYLSLEALRWLQDVGGSLVCVDRDGRLLVTSGSSRSEARLRRAQALAPFTGSGMEVARYLLICKLEGQLQLLDALPAGPNAYETVAASLGALQAAETVAALVQAEAKAAAAYWASWRRLAVRFGAPDRRRLPDGWGAFGSRLSPLTGSPRLAVTPGGAILNYLYALLETEARLACQILGLDPALALVHADVRGRDSLPLDLMEAVRPDVDRYLADLLHDRVFRLADFHETRRGSCRLLAPLTHELAGRCQPGGS